MQTPSVPPSTPTPEDGRRLARQRVRAQRRRGHRIRRWVVAATLSLFLVAWVAVFGQLVTGHDPALGATTRHPAKTSTAGSQGSSAGDAAAAAGTTSTNTGSSAASSGSSTGSSSSSGSGSSGASSSGSSSSGSSSSGSSASPVTTSQS